MPQIITVANSFARRFQNFQSVVRLIPSFSEIKHTWIADLPSTSTPYPSIKRTWFPCSIDFSTFSVENVSAEMKSTFPITTSDSGMILYHDYTKFLRWIYPDSSQHQQGHKGGNTIKNTADFRKTTKTTLYKDPTDRDMAWCNATLPLASLEDTAPFSHNCGQQPIRL